MQQKPPVPDADFDPIDKDPGKESPLWKGPRDCHSNGSDELPCLIASD
jgi:hypothetical protein